ncbi:hypothetical protein E3N88_21901 [Mikania micrantha]|uniref:Cytochrome b561 domain-containing protein n=1 Tax=Mikania micrantha TaxID=192012 RepID=A0A5N6NAR1_9ASTR|nr:hypothetical protein E3N88_21901 [Mikania micrantha]
MGLVTQEINSKPESVKKSLVKKILSQVFPFKSEKKTPLVQKDTRGRPTLKTQQQRGSESRQSAVVDSQESSFQLPRHSSFTPAMSNQQRPALQRSRSTSSRGKKGLETSQVDSVVASPVKPERMNNLRRFGRYIPPMLHCYHVLPPPGEGADLRGVYVTRIARFNGLIDMEPAAPDTNSYIAIGFSPNGRMVGSSAVVGWVASGGLATMKRYFLGGQTPSQVLVDQGDLQILGNTSSVFTDSARIYIAFQLVTNQPSERLVYAIGDRNDPVPSPPSYRLPQHRSQSSIRLNYASGQGSQTTAPYSNLKRSHGMLSMIGWGILIPLGAMVARYFKHLDSLWFYMHTGIQSLGFILGLAGVIAGLVLNDRLDANVGKHKGLGITILVLGFLQITAFLARPSVDAKMRKYWNWYHHNAGRLMILFAIANIFYGIHLAKAGSSWNGGYGVVLIVFVIIVVVLELKMLQKNRRV